MCYVRYTNTTDGSSRRSTLLQLGPLDGTMGSTVFSLYLSILLAGSRRLRRQQATIFSTTLSLASEMLKAAASLKRLNPWSPSSRFVCPAGPYGGSTSVQS